MAMRRIIGMGIALAAMSSMAVAFQEQKPTTQDGPQAGISADQSAPAKTQGTEVRIPGLGKLGVLPKMDFGLELLYGATDPKANVVEPPVPSRDNDDLTIRGSLKHRF